MISRKPKGKVRIKNKTPRRNLQENRMVRTIDDLAAFDKFKEEILPALQKAVAKGVKAKDIMEQYSSHAAARTVTIALTEKDPGKALNAAKDILDRAQGKAVERKEVKHKLQELTDEQLDALLMSEDDDDEAQSEEAATTESN